MLCEGCNREFISRAIVTDGYCSTRCRDRFCDGTYDPPERIGRGGVPYGVKGSNAAAKKRVEKCRMLSSAS